MILSFSKAPIFRISMCYVLYLHRRCGCGRARAGSLTQGHFTLYDAGIQSWPYSTSSMTALRTRDIHTPTILFLSRLGADIRRVRGTDSTKEVDGEEWRCGPVASGDCEPRAICRWIKKPVGPPLTPNPFAEVGGESDQLGDNSRRDAPR